VRSVWWRLAERRGADCVVLGFEIWFSGDCSVMLGGDAGVELLSRSSGEAMLRSLGARKLVRTTRSGITGRAGTVIARRGG